VCTGHRTGKRAAQRVPARKEAAMAKTKRLVTVTAGRLVHAVCYTQAMPFDTQKERRAKNKCSTEGRKRLNFIHTYQQCQLWLAANFYSNDLFITLSYSDEHLPSKRKDADKLLSKFLRQLRDFRIAVGDTLKYIRCTHELAGDDGRRLHHHIVINAGEAQRDFELIRSLWVWGDNIDISAIHFSGHYEQDDFLELAQYLTRERNPAAPPTTVGARSWSKSRNLIKPERKSIPVDENYTVDAPPGSFILESDERRNEYGTFKYIKYLLPKRHRRE